MIGEERRESEKKANQGKRGETEEKSFFSPPPHTLVISRLDANLSPRIWAVKKNGNKKRELKEREFFILTEEEVEKFLERDFSHNS